METSIGATMSAYYEVYGLQDFQPFALACRSCTNHVLSIVHGAYANIEPAAPHACELFYDGICDEARGVDTQTAPMGSPEYGAGA